MKNKILGNLNHVICAAMGLLTFIFFAFNYVVAFGKSAGVSRSEGQNGYDIMDADIWDDMKAGGCGVLATILQVFVLIAGIAMLIYGVFCLLRAMGILQIDAIPEKVFSKNISKYALFAYAGLNVLIFIFIGILTIANTESGTSFGVSYKYGLRYGAGMIITLIFSIGAVVSSIILPSKLNITDDGSSAAGPRLAYVCTQCGKAAKKGSRFCAACGGQVVEKVVGTTVYVCAQCGTSAKKDSRFCAACGGQVVPRISGASLYLCSSCGKRVKQGSKFCPDCGGIIVERQAETVIR